MSALIFAPQQQPAFVGAVAAGAIIAGVFGQDYLAYLCIAIPTIVSVLLWLRAGALGMPVLPMISSLFFIYYAVPLLRHEIAAYEPGEIFVAAATVGSFIVAASAASWPFYRWMQRRPADFTRDFVAEWRVVPFALTGIACGITYHLAAISGRLDWLGSSLGLVRAGALTVASIGCYLIGYARASKLLVGGAWLAALGSILTLVMLALAGLLLVNGLMILLAGFLGYAVTAKRIPWVSLGLSFAIIAVLHAGKYEMRRIYWPSQSEAVGELSISQVPGMMLDWFGAGIGALLSGEKEPDVLERASLLHMVLLVEQATPDFVPYLQGETYALLPSMLMPRFLDPDKTISQAGLNLLSVYYGLQTVESQENTTIAWGLVAEAWANFGAWGVIVAGALFGALCGAATRFSVGAAAISPRMFVTIAATLVLFDVEADFAYLLVTLMQALAAALLLAGFLTLARGPQRRPQGSTGAPFHTSLPSVGEASSAD